MHHLKPRIVAVLLLIALAGTNFLPTAAAQPKEPAPTREKEAALKKALLETARKTYEQEVRLRPTAPASSSGVSTPTTTDSIARWSRRWLKAQLGLADAKAERISAYRGHVLRMQDLEHRTALLTKSGMVRANEGDAAAYFRIQAELWLEQARAK